VAQPELIPAACEEFLRFYAPTLMGRVATQDTELGGRQIRRGDLLLLCNGAANRDPAVFHDPEKFIVDRDDARHISFGSGVHRCIGAPIGQLEVRIALEEWLKRIPEFRLADPDAVQWIPGPIWGAYNVHLEWDTP
jgi:cytochrome P450